MSRNSFSGIAPKLGLKGNILRLETEAFSDDFHFNDIDSLRNPQTGKAEINTQYESLIADQNFKDLRFDRLKYGKRPTPKNNKKFDENKFDDNRT